MLIVVCSECVYEQGPVGIEVEADSVLYVNSHQLILYAHVCFCHLI